jgi:DNA-directed RNA polymerase subunit F
MSAGIQTIDAEPEATQISEVTPIKEDVTPGGKNMAENSREMSEGFSETMDRAESVGQKMAQTTRGVFENVSKVYAAFFSIKGARKIAEVYIETNEKLAKESLDYGRKFVELSAGGARKFWEVAEEHGREARSGA